MCLMVCKVHQSLLVRGDSGNTHLEFEKQLALELSHYLYMANLMWNIEELTADITYLCVLRSCLRIHSYMIVIKDRKFPLLLRNFYRRLIEYLKTLKLHIRVYNIAHFFADEKSFSLYMFHVLPLSTHLSLLHDRYVSYKQVWLSILIGWSALSRSKKQHPFP